MVRNISSTGLAKLATKKGTEPIFIVDVDWAATGTFTSYADRDIVVGGVTKVYGRILSVGEVDNVVDVSGGSNSQEVALKLDDTDGTIKAIMGQHDIHKRAVKVYQWFAGLDLSDRFLVFEGIITSPIQWNEGDRTVGFNIVSRLEAQEIGFSADQGQFAFIPKDMVGKAWPIIFGKCFDVPALKVTTAITGTTLCGVDLIGGANLHNSVGVGGGAASLGASIAAMSIQASVASVASGLWIGVDDVKAQDWADKQNKINAAMTAAVNGWENQQACALAQRLAQIAKEGPSCNPIHILGGEDFPQNTDLVLNIKGALFFGRMTNDFFSVSKAVVPLFMQTQAQREFDLISKIAACTPTPAGSGGNDFDERADVPPTTGNFGKNLEIYREHGFFFNPTDAPTPSQNIQVAQQFWAEAGSQVTIAPSQKVVALLNGFNDPNPPPNAGAGIDIHSGQPITYIASITPGNVLAVKAYKTLHDSRTDGALGQRCLVNVPNDYYTIKTVNYGAITATTIVTGELLSTALDLYGNNEGWSDELYVTFESTVGPNIIDILIYIIETWTNGNGAAPNLTYDATSFAAVRTKLIPFPANFPLLDQRGTIDVLKDIAYQARCALWISEGKFYIKYLPEEPDADDTITVSDIQHQSISVELTPTENLETKHFVTWHLDWANGNGETPPIMVLRNNIGSYGTQRQKYDIYIYNQPDIVIKVATFWLIRKSNTWKTIKFSTALNKLNLDTFDCVLLDLPDYVSTDPVKAIITKASYDSLNNNVNFECLVPVRSGEMDPYKFFWPASLTATDVFPTPADIAAGNGGGGGLGDGVFGDLPIGYTGIIGRPGQKLNWTGEWDGGTRYLVNDVVLYNGGAYVALAANIGVDPGNLQLWELITRLDQESQGGTIFVGGPNIIHFGGSDKGDSTPGDVGFQAQPLISNTTLAQVNNNQRPYVDLNLSFLPPYPAPPVQPLTAGGATDIDIRRTRIYDSSTKPPQFALLSDLIKQVITGSDEQRNAGTAGIFLWADHGVATTTDKGLNSLKKDPDSKEGATKFGAGIAFLKDPDDETTTP